MDDFGFEDNDFGFEDQENQEFRDDIGAIERAAFPNVIDILERAGYENPENYGKMVGKVVQNPVHRFAIFTDGIARSINSQFPTMELSEEDIQFLIVNTLNLKNPEHKNPGAYIFGYIATKDIKERSLNKKILSKIADVLPSMKPPITMEDVIRYARLWAQIKNTRLE